MKIIVVLAVVSSCAGCFLLPTEEFSCVRGDMTVALPQMQDEFVDKHAQWMNDAVVCTINDIALVAPADPSSSAYYVLRHGEYESGRHDNMVVVMDGSYLHLFAADHDNDGHFDSVSYDTWENEFGYTSAEDWNLDGQADLRTTRAADGSLKREAWVNGRWMEYVIDRGFRLADDTTRRLKKGENGVWLIVPADD